MSGRAADDRSVADKLFAIADAFAAGEDLSLSEIAARARLPLSTAHRLVAEWVAWGGLVRGDDGRYRLGIKLWRLGARQPTARRLRSAALHRGRPCSHLLPLQIQSSTFMAIAERSCHAKVNLDGKSPIAA